ncbi:glucose 1-dehydrogenase [Paenibacillus sp. GD4]|jgi:NAD(P)-dependent dehydrogenase (short-subunit alcohol dehydrogenase family)|uniref:glucose 1-dehydrogenase n=1 Tax=Paenibacillus sp. GD4 TaxID=3068890 RepID=UPI0027967D19|nr:glucose 1-dehydrogenase [Paenibacillus sp. GD4]MDQ1909739.1 glucose 1-dehydrogenase [Paenibacillus sp. GD4]
MQKVAAITGGAQGIGKAVALKMAQAGYAVSLADTDEEAGRECVEQIRRSGGEGMFVRTDVGSESEAHQWLDATLHDWGRIDVLVNNAGISRNGPMLELSLADWDRVLGVNLRGTFVCSQKAAAAMKTQRSGVIINIASTRALMSEANTEAYSASKGGILALTHAMAVSLGPYGIRVNAISPGWIETRDWQKASKAEVPVHSERDRQQHPAGRVGRPDDIAGACLYLCGEHAGFITGQNLVIDGGMTVKMIYEE